MWQASSRGRRNNTHWKRVADRLDEWSRTAFPALYCLCLVILFSLDLTDDYAGEAPSKMHSGFGVVNLKSSGAISIVFYSLVILLVGCSWMMMRRIAEHKKKADEEAVKSAVRASISSRKDLLVPLPLTGVHSPQVGRPP